MPALAQIHGEQVVTQQVPPARTRLLATDRDRATEADDGSAYSAFFRANFAGVTRTVYLIVHDHPRAEDITQEAFLQLLRNWARISDYERPDAWVRRVAIRLAVRSLKRDELWRSVRSLFLPEERSSGSDVDVAEVDRSSCHVRSEPPSSSTTTRTNRLPRSLACWAAASRPSVSICIAVASGWRTCSARRRPMPLDHRLRASLRGAADDVRPDVEHHLARVRQRSRRRSIPASQLLASVAAIAVVVVLLRSQSLDPLAMIASVVAPGDPVTVASSAEPVDTTDALVGTYEVHLEDTVPDGGAASLAGDWQITLGADASIVLSPPDTFEAPSTLPLEGYVYALRGDRLFTNLFARHFQQGCSGSGTYRWGLEDAHLVIEVMDDMCLQRIALLTSRSWTLIRE